MKATEPLRSRDCTCGFTKTDGSVCRAKPMQGKSYCFWHDPEKATARVEAGRVGGSRKAARTLPEDSPELVVFDAFGVVELLSRTVNDVLKGRVDPRVANAVGYLSGVILRAREQGELEERIAKLEAAVDNPEKAVGK